MAKDISMPLDYDIAIAGGGPAGMTAAAAFGKAGLRVLCVDPAPPVTDRDAEGADLRTTAFLQPGRAFLDRIGVWPHLAAHAMPLQIMRIVDAGGTEPSPRVTRDFDASDISGDPFGWNVPNWLLRRALTAHLATLVNVDHRTGVAAKSLTTRESAARIGLTDGSSARVRLVIGADGRNSAIRRAAGIGVRTLRYGQKALAFAVTHDQPHHNVSTEVHRSGGPFTLVPLPDWQGQPSSAVVWMETGRNADTLAALDQPAFEAAMTERSARVLGPLRLASRITLWPIITQEAQALTAQRTALVAEAAHVMPPIGAQGLNMSLRDIETLHDLAVQDPAALGTDAMLQAYARGRRGDITLRNAGIAALNRISMAGAQPLRDMRATGLSLLYGLAPVRTAVMRLGLGTSG
jgi:2-octaprenyl-6-methoxyphenol hydroxylase